MSYLLKKVNFCQSCQIMDSRDASASKDLTFPNYKFGKGQWKFENIANM